MEYKLQFPLTTRILKAILPLYKEDNVKRIIVIFLVVGSGLIALRCTRKDINQITYVNPLPHIAAFLATYPDYPPGQTWTRCRAVVYNVASIPVVRLNQDTLPPIDFYNITYEKTGLDVSAGTQYTLAVQDQDRVAAATILQPDSLHVVFPTDRFSCLAERESVFTAWNDVPYAQWYIIVFQWTVAWVDSSTLERKYFEYDTVLVTPDTSYTFSTGRLWVQPDSNMFPADWLGNFYLIAGNGPAPIPGSLGNFTGDGTGFFMSMYLTDWYWLYPPDVCINPSEEKTTKPHSSQFEDFVKRILGQQLGRKF
jgi:hypothetical protein